MEPLLLTLLYMDINAFVKNKTLNFDQNLQHLLTIIEFIWIYLSGSEFRNKEFVLDNKQWFCLKMCIDKKAENTNQAISNNI